jgi:hypothetical protein
MSKNSLLRCLNLYRFSNKMKKDPRMAHPIPTLILPSLPGPWNGEGEGISGEGKERR